MKSKTSKRRAFLFSYFQPYLDAFTNDLSEKGYNRLTIHKYFGSIAHFGTWAQEKNILITDINYNVVSNFAKHRCHCPYRIKTHKISRKYIQRIKRFVSYLCQHGIIAAEISPPKTSSCPDVEKFKESLQTRGLSIRTITTYECSICELLPLLGNDSTKYTVTQIKQIICELAKKRSRCVIKKLTTALRIYLRFLITENKCCPYLDTAVPSVVKWKLSSLPKYISANEMEHMIAACNAHTPQGIRDKAIILLLCRLGLRSGDVNNMRIDDIDWSAGTIRVKGKGRREALLPLPQDVGDALLAYLKDIRPPVPIDRLFLCLRAPYRFFTYSSNIANIVSAALDRAGIKNPPSRGACLLRHTAATNMLRNGATLETVSAILRHRSIDMTGYYAKVDVPRLTQIAQPWPEDISC
jgi:integrase/recombinase XerD